MKLRDKLNLKAAEAVKRQREIIAAAEAENRDLTDDEAKAFDVAQTEIDSVAAQLKRLDATEATEKAIAESEARSTAPVTRNIDRVTTPAADPIRGEVTQKLTDAQLLGLSAWACAKNKHEPRKTAAEHLADAGFQKLSDDCQAARKILIETRAFSSIGVGAGDNTLMTPLSQDFIEFLRNEAVIARGGPTMVDLTNGKLDISGGNVGAVGTYNTEGANLAYTQATTRKVSMSAKHVGALTAIQNYNLSISPLPIAQILGEDLMNGIVLAMDSAGLRGDGTGANPTGLLSLIAAGNKFAALGAAAPTLAQIDTGIRNAQLKLMQANVPKRRWRWIMSSRTVLFLKYVRDGNGNKAYPSMSEANPTLDNIPVLMSEQVPSNLGVGTNESEIYLVDFGHFLMGIARALTLTSSTEASYVNASDELVSAFAQDQTVIRGIASHDFDIRHDKAGAVITGVLWGT